MSESAKLARLGAGIVLIVLGVLVLGISYAIKTNADSNFDTNQCGNILGAITGAIFNEAAQQCQNAQTISTLALMGEIVGVIMTVLGVVVTAVAVAKPTTKTKIETAPVPKVTDSNCKICGKYVDWWQNAVQQDTSLLHEKCYNTMGKRNDS